MGKKSWEALIKQWHGRWCVPMAEHRGPGRFGETVYWEERYKSAEQHREWFLGAEVAARSAAESYAQLGGASGARVLHLGSGTSVLGTAVCEALETRGVGASRVVNVDCSTTALRRLEDRDRAHRFGGIQRYAVWDATLSGGVPPGPYDLLLDKGTLDALQFAGPDPLVNYFTALRACFPALYLHWSDDDPEQKMELLTAAFPPSAFRVSWLVEEEQQQHQASHSSEPAPPSLFDWTYYRYTVRPRYDDT